MSSRNLLACVTLLLLSLAVNLAAHSEPAPPYEVAWMMQGTTDERFARAAKHLRGFDMAMVEVDYRYKVLGEAGRERNWDYATYQLKKIETAVSNGIERRPKRGPSSKMLEGPVAALKEAISKKDGRAFDVGYDVLSQVCTACHQVEGVGFIPVRSMR